MKKSFNQNLSNKPSLTGVILTFNETLHLRRAINALSQVCERVIIVDSYSTDDTLEIAKELRADIYQNKWENNHAKQMNWALENCNIKSEWVFRLDADEILEESLIFEINQNLSLVPTDINGIVLKRKNYFMDKWIKYGTYYPVRLIRIWRFGKGKSEQRLMDEHISVDNNATFEFKNDIADINLNNISWWSQKHIKYAQREAADFYFTKFENKEENITKEAAKKRYLKENFYYKLPIGVRPTLYFLYRYFIKLGFLDGLRGLIFHFLQGFWYRLLVDLNILEVKKAVKNESEADIKKYIQDTWGLEP